MKTSTRRQEDEWYFNQNIGQRTRVSGGKKRPIFEDNEAEREVKLKDMKVMGFVPFKSPSVHLLPIVC